MWQKIIFALSLLVSLYLCIGGIGNILITQKKEAAQKLPQLPVVGEDGVSHINIESLRASDEMKSLFTFYPIYNVSTTISYILTLAGFGIVGATMRLFLSNVKSNQEFSLASNAWIWIVLGAILGLSVLILDEILLPEFKYTSGNDKVYYSTAFLGGIFTEELFKWLADFFQKRLGETKK